MSNHEKLPKYRCTNMNDSKAKASTIEGTCSANNQRVILACPCTQVLSNAPPCLSMGISCIPPSNTETHSLN